MTAASVDVPVTETRRNWILTACVLATCARNIEPPAWVFRPLATDAFRATGRATAC